MGYIDGLMQGRCNSIANALELRFSGTKPLTFAMTSRYILGRFRNLSKIVSESLECIPEYPVVTETLEWWDTTLNCVYCVNGSLILTLQPKYHFVSVSLNMTSFTVKDEFGSTGQLSCTGTMKKLIFTGSEKGYLTTRYRMAHNVLSVPVKNTQNCFRPSSSRNVKNCHDDVIKWKHFPRYWSFVRGIHRSPVNSPHKGQ